jgi:4-hydroxy-4-methyl-2-oxoglutarate aldolase
MSNPPDPSSSQQEIAAILSRFDTCILADSLDHLGFQMHNRGFTSPGLRCFTGQGTSVAGYAVTARVRTSDPPITGHAYFRHAEWWAQMSRLPRPRIVVIEDIDRHPGSGASVGKIGAAVFSALHCIGAITNGAVREIQEVSRTGFALYAGHLSPSRSYAHLVDHSSAVEIYDLKISPGDLVVVDCHGALLVPPEALPQIAQVAAQIQDQKRSFVSFCQSDEFTPEGMESRLKQFQL